MAFNKKTAERVRDILAQGSLIDERQMFGGIAFMIHGHMCCGILGEDLVVRIGPSELEKALAQPCVRRMDFTGRPMKGFVYVGPEGFRSKASLAKWIEKAVSFVKTLPAK